MIIVKILAIIMIFAGSISLVFGLTYLMGCLFSSSNPFFLAWFIASAILAGIVFWLICERGLL